MNAFQKVVDEKLDREWNHFWLNIQKSVSVSNKRLFRVLKKMHGDRFVTELKGLMKQSGNSRAYLGITRKVTGYAFKKTDRTSIAIKQIWVDQRSSFDDLKATVYVEIRKDRFVYFNFYTNQ